ncbi:MAG: hypothetical protein IT289_06000, partial [Oligoflexia bacterium]|nr:hypothetical protein [Oligoflexia bacterium]
SNVGSQYIVDEALNPKEKSEAVQKALRSTFKPEFLNRVDDIITFNALSENLISDIVRVQLKSLETRLLEKKIHLEFSDDAIAQLAKVGYDPDFGARPLKRAIQSYIQNELAKRILGKEIVPGDRVQIGANKGEFSFKKLR